MNENFNLGDLVTFKTHPLLFDLYIKGDGKYVPPIMIVKEILFENKDKKEFDDVSGNRIAEKVKYICVHFDDNKSEFIESHLYHSQLESIKSLNIAKVDEKKQAEGYIALIDEVLNYPKFKYEFGKIVYFKTKKVEAFKKRESSKIEVDSNGKEEKKITRQYVVNYITPDFVICGCKNETYNDLYYNNGKPKRKASTNFIKVKWFNSFQQKFSEQYLPIEFFIDYNPFKSKGVIAVEEK
ncbi:hypothetical protein [Flavobacterium cyclinae]|uniref:hypothetical protein n=1 Tax=Flavobacterium cyclinae TaxID=2895947 RepID=UPI001E34797E|nr:hypothetical protein [Flavobacterium cyclinae]UGS20310.1 hypothetical protein LOS86_09780 [Flavobacterium cyclinae]